MSNSIALSIQYILIIWFIGLNRFFTKNQCIYLSVLLSIYIFLSSFIVRTELSIIILLLFYILEITFSYKKSNTFSLSTIFIVLENTLITLTWTITYDIPAHIVNINYSYLKFMQPHTLTYICQISFILLSLLFLNILNKKYLLWISIKTSFKKKDNKYLFIIFLNIFIVSYRQLLIYRNYFETYITLTIFICIFPIVIIYIVIITNRNYHNNIYIKILEKQVIENSDLLTYASEFQHDYKTFLYSTQHYLLMKDYQNALSYIQSLISYSTSLIETPYISQLKNIQSLAIQGVLLHCYEVTFVNSQFTHKNKFFDGVQKLQK